MSYIEAMQDGIQLGTGVLSRQYMIPCEICGEKIARTQYSRKRNYICKYCNGAIKKKEEILLNHLDGAETIAEKRINKALDNIAKQVENITEYEKAFKLAMTRAEKYGSVPEAMVAIELLKNNYKIIPQQKVGKYRVDFALPDIKTVIEVDGDIFHRNNRNGDREGTIQLSLGLDWKIVHIPAELISKDIRKLDKLIEKAKQL